MSFSYSNIGAACSVGTVQEFAEIWGHTSEPLGKPSDLENESPLLHFLLRFLLHWLAHQSLPVAFHDTTSMT